MLDRQILVNNYLKKRAHGTCSDMKTFYILRIIFVWLTFLHKLLLLSLPGLQCKAVQGQVVRVWVWVGLVTRQNKKQKIHSTLHPNGYPIIPYTIDFVLTRHIVNRKRRGKWQKRINTQTIEECLCLVT